MPGKARDFATPLDNRIPFVAGSVWIYVWSYTATFIPVFIIRSSRLFRRAFLAYTVAICVSLVCFATIPVTALHLRPGAAQLPAADPSQWAVAAIYSLDPPYNLFPSLHVCLTALAAISVWKANRWYGAVLFVFVGLVAISVCTVKQHFVLDSLAGLALAALVGGLILGPFQREDVKATYSWRGPASYFLTLLLIYIGLYTSFLLR